MADYVDIVRESGKDNLGGTTTEFLFAPISYFDTIADVVDPLASTADRITIADDHTFLVGKGFVKLRGTVNTGKLIAELTGERDGHGMNIKSEIFIHGQDKEKALFVRLAKNDEFITLIKDNNTGEYIQVGTYDIPVEIKGNFDSGTLSDGRKGWSMMLEGFGNSLLWYEGAILLQTA